MKHFLPLFVWLFSTALVFAQSDISERSDVNAAFAPFYHGVASGDPLSDRVIIWTRYTPDASGDPVTVNWEMATDTSFSSIAQSGSFETNSNRDWTVKIDVDGLADNTWYYYRFEYNGDYSITGRTRTAPSGMVDSLRFAIASCSDYVEGYFHGYRHMVERNDFDAVLHLGDYIYENGASGDLDRPHDPPNKTVALDDYRQRYSQYRLDPDLRCVHQMYPFINVWDDHESSNNAWRDGAEGHNSGDGPWEDRLNNATRAFHEWIPFREPNPVDSVQIYRNLKWGELVDLFMADTRIIGRDEQDENAIDDPNRHILGAEQFGWLVEGMDNSTSQWKLLGQQVLMASFVDPIFNNIIPFTQDAWNGYRWERDNLYDSVLVRDIENLVVLTGDIHTAWANNLEKGGDKVGVEFVTSSITKQNAGVSLPDAIITSTNPHIQYVELAGHGYYILDINQERVQTDFQWIGDITDPADFSHNQGPHYSCVSEARELTEENGPSVPRSEFPVLQPEYACSEAPNSIREEELVAAVFGTYPNPFWDDFAVKTYLFERGEISIEIYNMTGALVASENFAEYGVGLHYIDVNASHLPKGTYLMKMQIGEKIYSRTIIKA